MKSQSAHALGCRPRIANFSACAGGRWCHHHITRIVRSIAPSSSSSSSLPLRHKAKPSPPGPSRHVPAYHRPWTVSECLRRRFWIASGVYSHPVHAGCPCERRWARAMLLLLFLSSTTATPPPQPDDRRWRCCCCCCSIQQQCHRPHRRCFCRCRPRL